MAALGIFVGLRAFQNRKGSAPCAFMAVSALGMLLLGGWVLAGSARIDTLMYGRYMGPWVVPLTVIGIAAVGQQAVRTREQIFAVLLVTASIITVISASGAVNLEVRRIMTLSLSSLWATFDARLIPVALTAGLIAVVGLASVRRGPLIPLALVVMIAAPSTVINHLHLHGVGQIADGQASTSDLVPDHVSCLAHDTSTKNYAIWLYRLELPEIQHQRVDLVGGEEPCSSYVIAATNAFEQCGDITLLGLEPRARWGLWHISDQGCF
jgi:hypothetical protein